MRAWLIIPLLLASSAATAANEVVLFNGKDLTGWKNRMGNRADSWIVRDGTIVCVGGRSGGQTLETTKAYTSYRLQLDYAWVGKGEGSHNGGVMLRTDLVHFQGDTTTFFKNYQVQVHAPEEGPSGSGDIWLVGWNHPTIKGERPRTLAEGPARANPGRATPPAAQQMLRRPVTLPPDFANARSYMRSKGVDKPLGQWNSYDITLAGGTLIVKFNGEEVNRLTGVPEGVAGGIGLECGAPDIAFRNIRVTPIEK